ncbi:hypothetical protein KIPB_011260, partial [Kipferlia bialata]
VPSDYDDTDDVWVEDSMALSLYGSTFVIGAEDAHYNNEGSGGRGSAYVYRYTEETDTWDLVAEIRNTQAADSLQSVLALTETHVVVGGSRVSGN